LKGLCDKIGEEIAVREMRTQLACYFHGQKKAAIYKTAAMQAQTYEEVDAILTEWVMAVTSENSQEDL
jgi:tRNA-dihydrouridine synthase